jgi:hypothetical protein
MSSDAHDEFDDEDATTPDEWEEFRDRDGDPIGIEELKRLNLQEMPEDVSVLVMDNYFPETTVSREGEFLVCEIQEHLYTKYWEHKFSAYAFAEAMERAIRRLCHEGHPFSDPSRDDEDVHIFVRWNLNIRTTLRLNWSWNRSNQPSTWCGTVPIRSLRTPILC